METMLELKTLKPLTRKLIWIPIFGIIPYLVAEARYKKKGVEFIDLPDRWFMMQWITLLLAFGAFVAVLTAVNTLS